MLPNFQYTRWNWKESNSRRSRRRQRVTGKGGRTPKHGDSLFTDTVWRRTRKQVEETTIEVFRRPFVGSNPSLEAVTSAQSLGIAGDFTYSGAAGFVDVEGSRGKLLPHGEGEQKGRLGEVLYQGMFETGRRHGQGISYRRNGSVEFDGTWSFDVYGEGEYYNNRNRLEYAGTFDRKNRPNGSGTFYFVDGSEYCGDFLAGLFHGHGKRIQQDGQLIVEGRFEVGRIVKGMTQENLTFPESDEEVNALLLSETESSGKDDEVSTVHSSGDDSELSSNASSSQDQSAEDTSALLNILADSGTEEEDSDANDTSDKNDTNSASEKATLALLGAMGDSSGGDEVESPPARIRCDTAHKHGRCKFDGRPDSNREKMDCRRRFAHPEDDDWDTAQLRANKMWKCLKCGYGKSPESYNMCGQCQIPREEEENVQAQATSALLSALGTMDEAEDDDDENSAKATSALLGALGSMNESEDDDDSDSANATSALLSLFGDKDSVANAKNEEHCAALRMVTDIIDTITSPPSSPQHHAAVNLVDFVMNKVTSPQHTKAKSMIESMMPGAIKLTASTLMFDNDNDNENEKDTATASVSDDSHDSVDSDSDNSVDSDDSDFDEREIEIVTKLQNLIRSFLLRLVERDYIEYLKERKKQREEEEQTNRISRVVLGKEEEEEKSGEEGNSSLTSITRGVYGYSGPYSINTGLPHGHSGTFRFPTPLRMKKERMHYHTTYVGEVFDGMLNGSGRMEYIHSSAATAAAPPSSFSSTSTVLFVQKILVQGIWENGDPSAKTHSCYGTMYKRHTSQKTKTTSLKPKYYGRLVGGLQHGQGIRIISHDETKHQVGRWWFGRKCGCHWNKRGIPVEMNTNTATDLEQSAVEVEESEAEAESESESDENNMNKMTTSLTSSYNMMSTFPSKDSTLIHRPSNIYLTEDDTEEKNANIHDTTITTLSSFHMLNNGTSFRGSLFNGSEPCGEGTLVVPRGVQQMNPIARVYDGQFEGGLPTTGVTRWENGDIYIGEHDKYGRPHGIGKMSYGGCDHHMQAEHQHSQESFACPRHCSGPLCYDGTFFHGDLQGQGKMTFMDGKIYHGEFYRSMMAGNGKMTYLDGRIVIGFFLLAKPLHLASHVVHPATLHGIFHGAKYVYAGKVVAGYPHGTGKRSKRHQTSDGSMTTIVEEGSFWWGIFVVPVQKWMAKLCVELLEGVYMDVERREKESDEVQVVEDSAEATSLLLGLMEEEEVVEVASDSEAATSALMDLIDDDADEVDSDSANATNAMTTAAKLTEQASASKAQVLEEEDAEMNQAIEDQGEVELQARAATNSVLQAARVVDDSSEDEDIEGIHNTNLTSIAREAVEGDVEIDSDENAAAENEEEIYM